MATYTDALGFNKGSAGFHAVGLAKLHRVEVTLDFAKIAAARLAAGATALAASDVLEVIPLPAKSLVLRVGMDVTTAEGATATLAIGDGDDDNGYLAATSINSVASTSAAVALTEGTPNTFTTPLQVGKYYGSADTIDVLLGHNNIDTAVVRIWALVMDCS